MDNDFFSFESWGPAQSNDDDWYSEADALDDFVYGKGFQKTYTEPDISDFKAKGW